MSFPIEFRMPTLGGNIEAKAEEIKRQEEERTRKALENVAAAIDDFLEELGLGHPVTALYEFIEDFSPYSILTRKLGIPAPGDILDAIRYRIEAVWKSLPPLIPKPTGVPEIRHLKE